MDRAEMAIALGAAMGGAQDIPGGDDVCRRCAARGADIRVLGCGCCLHAVRTFLGVVFFVLRHLH